jgi:hypothetical protein
VVSRVAFFCWEVGGALGHITSLRTIALEFQLHGFRCVFAVKDLASSYELLHREGFEVFQAPIKASALASLRAPANYAEILLKFGYLNAEELAGQIVAWKSLDKLIKPDVVIADSAPTITLALRGSATPLYLVSNGFGAPPDESSWPAFPSFEKQPPDRFRNSEKALLTTINTACQNLDIPKLDHIGQLHPKERTYLACLPGLDHYTRLNGRYIGSTAMGDFGIDPQWPVTMGPLELGTQPPKVFAYLKPNYREREALLGAISDLPIQIVAFIPGLSIDELKRWNTASMSITTSPVNVDAVLAQCDFVLCHGGGLVQKALLAGVPVFALPMQAEQTMTANRLKQLGLGSTCEYEAFSGFKKQFKDFLLDKSLQPRLQAFAIENERYRGTKILKEWVKELVSSIS